MSAPKPSWSDRVVAGIAGSIGGRLDAAKLVRRVIFTGVKVALLIAASRQVHGWLGVVLLVMAALLVFPLFFIGLAQRAADERAHRLSLVPASLRAVLVDKKRLYAKGAS